MFIVHLFNYVIKKKSKFQCFLSKKENKKTLRSKVGLKKKILTCVLLCDFCVQ